MNLYFLCTFQHVIDVITAVLLYVFDAIIGKDCNDNTSGNFYQIVNIKRQESNSSLAQFLNLILQSKSLHNHM